MALIHQIVLGLLVAGMLGVWVWMRAANLSDPAAMPAMETGMPMFVTLALAWAIVFFGTLVFILGPAWSSEMHVSLPDWVRWMGLGTLAAALVWTGWSIRSQGFGRAKGSLTATEDRLVPRGPYGMIRQPRHTGTYAFLAGLCIASGSVIIALGSVVALGFLHLLAVAEESTLHLVYGSAYGAYARSTGRYLPKVR